MSLATAAHRLLKQLPPELAHRLAVRGMRKHRFAPGLKAWVTGAFASGFSLCGHVFTNPLGLAAGFDKHGVLVDAAQQYGFGWVEVGSVTYEPHTGNTGKRMFRVNAWDIQNRMGLNGPGAHVVRERLLRAESPHYGVSIAKSNKPEITGERGIADVLKTVGLLNDLGAYHVINLSCPNSHDGQTFEDAALLRELLPEVRSKLVRPWGVKLSPHRSKREMDATLAACEAEGCWFYILGNTRPAEFKGTKGGRSGRSLLPLALPRVRWLKQTTGKPVIACGGVHLGEHAYLYQLAGADAVQAYNGFVRGPASGPTFAHTVLDEWMALRAPEFDR